MTFCRTEYPSTVGRLTLASDGSQLLGLWLEGQKYFCATVCGEMIPRDDLRVFAAASGVPSEWHDKMACCHFIKN